MTNLKIHPFLILLVISLPIFAAAGQLSQVPFVSGTHQIVATIYRQGEGFGENEVLSFRSSAGGEALMTMESNGFERPVLFRHHGEDFVHVSTTPAGSGAFVTDTVFWIAPDATMHEIEFKTAAVAREEKINSEETVLTGGSGVNCTGGKLTFEFYIANKADPHCCPTAGRVTGSYKIVGKRKFDPVTKQYSSTFKIVTKQYTRTPVSAGEMSTNFAK
jgi:hypothetical protein